MALFGATYPDLPQTLLTIGLDGHVLLTQSATHPCFQTVVVRSNLEQVCYIRPHRTTEVNSKRRFLVNEQTSGKAAVTTHRPAL